MIDAFIGFVWLVVLSAAAFALGTMIGESDAMQQAYKRGYAVECVGQTGYHWECEE